MNPEQDRRTDPKPEHKSSTLKDLACMAALFAGLAMPSAEAAQRPERENPPSAAKSLNLDQNGLAGFEFGKLARMEAEQALQVAPNFTLQDLDGNSVSLKDTMDKNPGKVILLKFGASWCGPCRASTPQLNELHEKYKDKLVILDVNEGESRETARRYAESHGTKYKTLLDSDMAVGRQYQVTGIPKFVLIKNTSESERQIMFSQAGYDSSPEAKKAFHDSITKHFH